LCFVHLGVVKVVGVFVHFRALPARLPGNVVVL
jgi:hypothetical protein